MYSAIKIQGKKLYELARKGREVERPPTHHHPLPHGGGGLEVRDRFLPVQLLQGHRCPHPVTTLSARPWAAVGPCSPAAHHGRFFSGAGPPLEQVLSHPEPQSLLLPVDAYFQDRPPITLPRALEKRCAMGCPFPSPAQRRESTGSMERTAASLALSQVRQGVLTTVKAF